LHTSGGRSRTGSLLMLGTRTDLQAAVTLMEGTITLEDETLVYDSGQAVEVQHEDPPKKVSFLDKLEKKRLLPFLLLGSLLLGASCMLSLQRYLVGEILTPAYARAFALGASLWYVAALGFMAFVAFSDPGQIDEEVWESGVEPPKRSHKSWQYERDLRRFDHYCRWVGNGIALRNHREFVVMLISFVVIAVVGSIVDVILAYECTTVQDWTSFVVLLIHLLYQLGFAYYVIPIFRLHVGFVSRNELANEWKHDKHYIVYSEEKEDYVWVGDLEAEEFDELFDSFEYDPTKNEFDRGCSRNCFAFWCTPRCRKGQLGEF